MVAENETPQCEPDEIMQTLGVLTSVRRSILADIEANQSPSVANVGRQTIDALDTAVLFYQQFKGVIAVQGQMIQQQADQEVTSGNILDFPGGQPPAEG